MFTDNEFVNALMNVANIRTRDVIITSTVGELLYDDQQGQYNQLVKPLDRAVSSVESFWQATIEETRRRAMTLPPIGHNGTGKALEPNPNAADFVTALFTEDGGKLYTDDTKGQGRQNIYYYTRKHSAPYMYLKGLLDNAQHGLKHQELLKGLQRFGPSYIADYDQIMLLYRRVSFTNSTKVDSQPIVTNGEAGRSIEVVLATKSGDMETSLPGQLTFTVPFVMGEADRQRFFSVDVLIDMSLSETGEPKFYLYAPRFEAEKERCILQEVDDYREATKDLSNLLILNSF